MTDHEPKTESHLPTQADFIKRLASLPHTSDGGPATYIEMGGALKLLNDAIEVAREIIIRDHL